MRAPIPPRASATEGSADAELGHDGANDFALADQRVLNCVRLRVAWAYASHAFLILGQANRFLDGHQCLEGEVLVDLPVETGERHLKTQNAVHETIKHIETGGSELIGP